MPLVRSIVQPIVGYRPLGADDADVQHVISTNVKHLTDEIVQAVVRQAVVALTLQVGLMCIPVIGWAIAAVVAVTQQITGKIYEAQMKKVINNCIGDIKQRGEDVKARVQTAAIKVANEELPAAQALAVSNVQLNGLGDFWSKSVKSVEKVFKSIPKELKHVGTQIAVTVKDPNKLMKALTTITSPIGLVRIAAKDVGKAAVFTAKAVESTGVIKKGSISKELARETASVNDVMYSAQKLTSPLTAVQEGSGLAIQHGSQVIAEGLKVTGNEKSAEAVLKAGKTGKEATDSMMTALTPIKFYNLFTGREEVVAAKDACDRMRSQAFAALDKTGTDAIAELNSPSGRQKMRVSLAKGMRQDPAFAAKMQELRDLQSQQSAPIDAQHAVLEQQVGRIPNPIVTPLPANVVGAGTNTTAIIGTAAAAVGAFLFFR
jgi:hypothetical protein